MEKTSKVQEEKHLTGTLVLSVFAAVLGFFQYGYGLGVLNAPQRVIEAHYSRVLGIAPIDRSANNFTDTNGSMVSPTVVGQDVGKSVTSSHHILTLYWSLSVSIFAVGGMISSFTVGWIGDKLGRVKAMLAVNVLSITGNLLMGLAKFGPSHILIIAGRAITGLYCGNGTSCLCQDLWKQTMPHMKAIIRTCSNVCW
nr:solute carrier family 2, facilitated glucose transporter member 2-like [Pelodiscus sinensis]|eukprot:XP_025039296.1 solute carrier family 2, facilitated glucose transporter member 2-like [Pelodiscus sinensis]